MVGGLELVDIAGRSLLVDPVQEFRNHRAIALLRRLLASNLGWVLDRLGQDGGVAEREDLGSGVFERLEDCGDGALGIDDDGLALVVGKGAFELAPLMKADAVPKVLANFGID